MDLIVVVSTQTQPHQLENSPPRSRLLMVMEFQDAVQKDALSRTLTKFLTDTSYKEFIKSSSTFNHKLVRERKFRLPFLDSQTGVAQSDCCLWMTEKDRQIETSAATETTTATTTIAPEATHIQTNSVYNNNYGDEQKYDSHQQQQQQQQQQQKRVTTQFNSGRIYTYPAKRWVKRKRQYLLDDVYLRNRLSNPNSQQNHLSSGPSSSNLAYQQDQSVLMDHSSNDTQQLLHHHHTHPHHQSSSSSHVRISDAASGHNNISFNHSNSHNESINHASNNNNSNNHQHHLPHHQQQHHHYNNDSSFMHDSSSNSNAYPWNINEQSKDATSSSKIDPDESTSEATAHGDDSNDPHSALQFMNHQQQQQQHPQSHNHNPIKQNTNQSVTPTPKKKRERKFKIEKTNDPLEPYKCEWCEKSYKTRPGLTYHRNHCHAKNVVSNSSDETIIGEEQGNNSHGNTPNSGSNHIPTSGLNSKQAQSSSSSTSSSLASSNHLPGGNSRSNGSFDTNHSTNHNNSRNGTSKSNSKSKTKTTDNSNDNSLKIYCDFCYGGPDENKKTQLPEELISCDCGRSAHPTCLNFTANTLLSVKKYKWQCIECKSCILCGKSDNDDKLLFCDDCDRGYHMYCLKPPLDQLPEGSWSCDLCMAEYYGAKPKSEKTKQDGGEESREEKMTESTAATSSTTTTTTTTTTITTTTSTEAISELPAKEKVKVEA